MVRILVDDAIRSVVVFGIREEQFEIALDIFKRSIFPLVQMSFDVVERNGIPNDAIIVRIVLLCGFD